MRRATLALLAVFLLLWTGCGGGEESTSETASGREQTSIETNGPVEEGKRSPTAGEKGSDAAAPGEAAPDISPTPPEIPVGEPEPGSERPAPGVPITEGGDNSIQSFGIEGEAEQREGAVANLLAYLDARLAGEFELACSLASAEFREQLALLVENAKAKDGAEKPKGCAETLALFTPEKARAALRERSRISEVLSFRVRDDGYAYLIYKGVEGEAMFIAMADDEGQWRVNVPGPEGFAR